MGEILFLAHRVPFPPDRGDKIRSHHVLRALATIAPVHVGAFADDARDRCAEAELALLARSHCVVRRTKPLMLAGAQAMLTGNPVSMTAFHDPALVRYVRETLEREAIGAIYVFSGQMAQYVPADFAGRVIVDFVDADSAKFEAYAQAGRGAARWLHAREGRLLRAAEARSVARADAALLATAEEAALFAARLGPDNGAAARVLVLRNGVDAGLYDPGRVVPAPELAGGAGPALIFAGQMDYPPNVAAAVRAARRIMPLIRRRVPGAVLHIVGRNPVRAVRALEAAGACRVWGEVPDIRPWLRGARLALVPLEIARGVQNKVLEAMAMALPVVATGAAATGIGADADQHLLVSDSDEALAEAAIALLTDRPRAHRIGANARRFVQQAHGWEAALSGLPELIAPDRPGARDAA